MSRRLSNATDLLDELGYPIQRDDAAAAVSDVTLLLADGERNLGALLSKTATRSTAQTTFSRSYTTPSHERPSVSPISRGEG